MLHGKNKNPEGFGRIGKTYRLAYEYIRNVIASPGSYRHILAVTFTNKATEEMKQRIVSELNALAEGRGGYLALLEKELDLAPGTIRSRAVDARTKILHDYSRFTVVTIDKFFQRIIRSFIKELGIDIHYNLELQTDSLLESATDRMIDEIAVNRRLRDGRSASPKRKSSAAASGTSARKYRNWGRNSSRNSTKRWPNTRRRAKNSCGSSRKS